VPSGTIDDEPEGDKPKKVRVEKGDEE